MCTNEIWTPEDKDFIPEGYRLRWIYDEDYSPYGRYALDTEEETQAAIDWEMERLEAGTLTALGYILESRCSKCGKWVQEDSLWGIVIPDTQEEKENMFKFHTDLDRLQVGA
jgi:hypothetical protein